MRSPRRPKDLAREAVFQLDRLSAHENLFRPWRRPISGTVERIWHLNLLFDVGRLILGRSRYDARVAERCAEESTHGENVQNATDDRNAPSDALGEEWTVEGEEESTGAGDEHDREIEDARVGRCYQVTVAVKLVAAGEELPLSRDSLSWSHLYSHLTVALRMIYRATPLGVCLDLKMKNFPRFDSLERRHVVEAVKANTQNHFRAEEETLSFMASAR